MTQMSDDELALRMARLHQEHKINSPEHRRVKDEIWRRAEVDLEGELKAFVG